MVRHSSLCPHCRRIISQDESVCPYCGLKNPTVWWRRIAPHRVLLYPGKSIIDPVQVLIYLNVIIYFFSLLLTPSLGLQPNPLFFWLLMSIAFSS